jgi:glycogen synthase
MRVLMTADAVGGVWTYAIELANALEAHGIEIILATMGARPTTDQRAQAHSCANVQLVESTYKLEWMEAPWADVDRAGDWLLALDQEHVPDVVHLNGYAHGALSWSAPAVVVGHSCVRSWWRAVKGAGAPAEWDEYTRRVRAGLLGADLVVAPTRAMLESLRAEYTPFWACDVIPNGRTIPRVRTARKEPLVFAAGRVWDEAKNVAMLARVAPRLPWPVAIAGALESPDGSSADKAGGVQWLGRLSSHETTAWMTRASIYALPARYEPFGLSALEAALCGSALVLGDIATLREVWGDAALYVDPADDDGFVNAVGCLCRDRDLRHTLVQRARTRAAELTSSAMAVRYAAAYARAMEGQTATEAAACAS